MRRIWICVATIFAFSSPLWAQTVITPLGNSVILDTGRTTAAASTNAANLSAAEAAGASVFYTGTTGTLSTQLQVSCNAGVTWVAYPGVAAVTALPAVQVISTPIPCLYRLNTATCTSCTLNATLFISR